MDNITQFSTDATVVECRQDRNKTRILEELRKVPIVELACRRIGVARSTFYRWKNDDSDFRKVADEAVAEGTSLIGDIAESQLLTLIKNGNLSAVIFWLKSRDRRYSSKMEFSGHIEHVQKRELTPDERALIEKSLRLAMPSPKIVQLPGTAETPPSASPPTNN